MCVFYLFQDYLTSPVQVKVGKVSCPTANVSQKLEKVSEGEKVCFLWHISIIFFYWAFSVLINLS